MSMNKYSLEIGKDFFSPPLFTGYFLVEGGFITLIFDNKTSSNCLLPGSDINKISTSPLPYSDNIFDEVNLRFSFNGVMISSTELQNAFEIKDSNLFNIFAYNTTAYSYYNYLETYPDDPNLKNFPLLSSGNILFHYNDVYVYIRISKLNS